MEGRYSIVTGEKGTLGTVDYVVFSLLICASAAIGFYHAYKDRNKKNVEDFQLGGRQMHPIPVSLSLSATFMSAITLLGTPAEVYTNNTMFYWIVAAMFIATFGSAHVFIPIFYRLNRTSCFEYLELRFGKLVRMIASVIFILQTLVFMGAVLYAPSLAFEAVTGVSLWGSMLGVALVCTLYTALGGMKTVLWTDSLQFTVMIAGLLLLVIHCVEGAKACGGLSQAWNIARVNGRIMFTDFSVDPRTRHSVWSVGIGAGLFWTYLYGINQAQVQRACSVPTLRKMKIAVWLNYPFLVLINTLACLLGVVMYAFYSECHPVAYGLVERSDQLVPLFVLDIISKIPGLSGVFMACVFSGSLSTVSSGLNAMSAIVLEDFIKPFCCKDFVRNRAILLSKILVVLIGFSQFGMAVVISSVSALIIQFTYSLFSVMAGPLFGLFVSGMIFPWTNKYGATTGFIISFVFTCWLGFGYLVEKPSGYKPLPVSTEGCNWNLSKFSTESPLTTTFLMSPTTPPSTNSTLFPEHVVADKADESLLHDFYRISYMWYTGIGMMVHVIVALIVSVATGRTDPKTIDTRLMVPLGDILFPYLPENIRRPLRFGVVYDDDSYITDDYQGPGSGLKQGKDNSSFDPVTCSETKT